MADRLPASLRRAALGGVVAVGGFVGAWAVQGARRAGYSPIDDAISRLAEVGAPDRSVMTAGFVVFGLGTPVYALALREAVHGPAWMGAAATGLATLGVATSPLGSADTAHYVFATIGYVTLAATPLLAARTFRADGATGWARWSTAAGLASAITLALSTVDRGHGLTQRLGLGFTDAWIVATAVRMWRDGRITS